MPSTVKPRFSISHMAKIDMPQAADIDRQCFMHDRWNAEDFAKHLRSHRTHASILRYAGKLAGFCVYENDSKKAEIEIVKLGVTPACRRLGIGAALLTELRGLLCAHRSLLTIMVRESNDAAQLFFRRMKFKAVKVVRAWFEDTGEDGYWFEGHNDVK